MTMQNSKNLVDEAIKDPSSVYKTPKDVLADDRLTQEDKEKILESWHEDAEALLRAEEENMPSPRAEEGEDSSLLREVVKSEEKIKK